MEFLRKLKEIAREKGQIRAEEFQPLVEHFRPYMRNKSAGTAVTFWEGFREISLVKALIAVLGIAAGAESAELLLNFFAPSPNVFTVESIIER